MAFDWSDFLSLAEMLRSSKGDAERRTAVSRAYYAAFHAARRYMKANHPEVELPREGEAHARVWTEVEKHDQKAGADGFRLRKQRNWADYDLASRNWANEANSAVLQAGALIRRLAPAPSVPTLPDPSS